MRASRFPTLYVVSLLSLSLFLSACGGGGDASAPGGANPGAGNPGATAPPAPGFSVAIDRSELVFAGAEGASIAPAVVLGAGSGTPPDPLYLGSLDLGSAIERVTVEAVGAQAKFTVYPKSTLAPGMHRGNLQLFACRDSSCATHVNGSPVNVPYVVTLARGWRLSPSSLQLHAISGATASAPIAVQLPEGQAGFRLGSSAPWLELTDVTATGFTAVAKAMPPGRFSATISVITDGGTRTVPLDYEVVGDAGTVTSIIPDAPSLSFSATVTGAAPARVLNLTLPSWVDDVDFGVRYVSPATNWLSVTRSGPRSLRIAASAASLQAGTYQAELELKVASGAPSVKVPVSFAVGAAGWTVEGVVAFRAVGDSNAATLAGDLVVKLPGLPPLDYTAVANVPWLKLSQIGGTAGGTAAGTTGGAPLRASVDIAELLKLENFRSYQAEIAIRAVDSRIAPFKVTVGLDKALAELHYVSPRTRLPGEGGVYTLRGRGLDGVSSLSAALAIEGANASRITRVNDTEITVQLAGAAGGDVGFSLANGLGVSTGKPLLRTLAQPGFTYAALDTEGAKSGLVFDAERQALYSVNRTLASVMRFVRDTDGWRASSAPLPGADAVALAPDGKMLVATTKDGIVLLDPDSLARLGTYPATIGADAMNSLPRLAVTNDGRAYFQGGYWGGLGYFDLVRREFGMVPGQRYDFYSGPWFSVSGDGSRLLVVQSASISPQPPMLYLDSSDAVPKVNPAGLTFWYEAAQSLRGERFVQGAYKVWDREFSLIGNLTLPDATYIGVSPLVSPDGERTYVLAYPESGLYGGAATPRVYVFDSSTRMVTKTDLPLLGYFDIADYPTCHVSAYECSLQPRAAISPDGQTLFFAGDRKLVVAPVPALTMAGGGARAVGAPAPAPLMRRVRMTP